MSGVRRLLLDAAPGERRGVVLLDGRPERLLIERDGEAPAARLGDRRIARVAAAGAGGGRWLDLGVDAPGWLPRAPADLPEGAAVEVEVAAEARRGKGPRLRLRERGEGPPRLIAPGPDLLARLQGWADAAIETGAPAREAADEAEAQALAAVHPLPRGLTLTVEPTRALTAVDVDLAPHAGGSVQDANLRAIRHAARLLRLKALGGTAVIDLVGARHAAGLLRAEAARAFAPDGLDARVLAPDALGLLAVSRPHAEAPVAERLLDGHGRPTARTLAQRRVRDLERELAARPGVLLELACPPDVALALAPWAAVLGPRVRVAPDLAAPREPADMRVR